MKQILTRLLLFLAFAMFSSALMAQAGDDRLKELKTAVAPKDGKGWTRGGSFGLDLTGLGLINPRLGAGANRFGFGGLVYLFANDKQDNFFWDNSGSLQLAALRVGGKSQPFQKNVDIIRLNSRYGYNIIKDKLFAAIDAQAETQLLPTYVGNVLSSERGSADLLSEFFAPVRVAVSPGLDYRPSKSLSFFVSPISMNLIYVGNDSLAALPNQPLGNEAGKNNRLQLGYALKAAYTNKYFKDRVTFTSKIGWFADYRQQLNGNVLWQNNMSISIFKGVSLDLFGELFYDHFTKVIVEEVPTGTDPAAIGPYLGLKPSYTGGFLLKYNRIF